MFFDQILTFEIKEGLQNNIYKPILKIDPNMRCAVLLIYGYKLAVIPLHEDHGRTLAFGNLEADHHQTQQQFFRSESKSNQQQISKPATSINQSSYTIDLRKIDQWLEMHIIDIEFLYGYYEPTLFILCESTMTWVGR